MPHAREKFGSIFLDFLAAASAVAQLAPVHLSLDELHIDGNARGKSRNPRYESLPMGFTRRHETQHYGSRPVESNTSDEFYRTLHRP
jgi:hypothetical protein